MKLTKINYLREGKIFPSEVNKISQAETMAYVNTVGGAKLSLPVNEVVFWVNSPFNVPLSLFVPPGYSFSPSLSIMSISI